MTAKIIRIATRQSPLALWQAQHIRTQLLVLWPQLNVELLPMTTSGDQFLKDKLLAAGGKGLFVKELEEALLDKRADIAVHSTKDMPALLPPGLDLSVICQRENPFDALVSKRALDLNALPKHAVVGTASLRRQSQLLAYRPDLHIKLLRGNINTRLAKLETGEYDAIILAAAGLERMNMHSTITELLPAEIMLPTCGQGALCIEARCDDLDIQQLIAPLHDANSARCVQTERQVNALLGGNCHVPLAVFCIPTTSNQLLLRARILSTDGTRCIEAQEEGPAEEAELLAQRCTATLLAQGALALIEGS